jgi:predicted nucleic acid-binding protein
VTPVVVDASVIVEYLLGSHLGAAASKTIEDGDVDLHAPSLCDVEVVSALRGLVLSGKVPIARALEVLEDYTDLPLTRHSHVPLLERLLALRDNFSAYDATYVALAEALEAKLLTCDDPLARSVKAHLPRLGPLAIAD